MHNPNHNLYLTYRPYKALYVNAAGKDCGFFPWEWTANGCDTAKDAAVAIQTAPGALLGGYNPNDKPHISKSSTTFKNNKT